MKGDHVLPTAPPPPEDDRGTSTGTPRGAGAGRAAGALGAKCAPARSPRTWLGATGWLLGTAVTLVFHAAGFGGCTLEVEGKADNLTPCTIDTDCSDNNECTTNICNTYGVCVYVPLDGVLMARQEPADCRINICRGGQPAVELDPGDVRDDENNCTIDSCDAASLETVYAPLAVGATCDDGGGNLGSCGCLIDGSVQPCPAGTDPTCQVECNVANAAEVCNDDRFCTEDSCDVAQGYCLHPGRDLVPLPEDQQTPGDCRTMICQDAVASPAPGVVDNQDTPADDGEVCTDEVCDAGWPVHRGNSASCDDGVYCNGTDTCVPFADPNTGGDCTAHTGDPCPGPNGDDNCSESCNESADNCTAPDPDASACNDGVYCNGADTCLGGTCSVHGVNPCPPRNPLLNDCTQTCTEAAGGSCNGNDAQGAVCNDTLYCNGTDTCDASGSCSVHANAPCTTNHSDGDCLGTCREATDDCLGAEPNGSACTDGLYCNGTDTCLGGACSQHANAPSCPGPDGDSNCSESCLELGGGAGNCSGPDVNGSACNDGIYCNGTDSCAAGACSLHGSPPACPGPDGDGDCSETCQELGSGTGDCDGPDPGTPACDDGLYCNGADTCNAGECTTHAGNPCPARNPALDDCTQTCTEASGGSCNGIDTGNPPCNDGEYCTETDACDDFGACVGTGNPCPADPDGCDNDCSNSCNETADDCTANDPVTHPCGPNQTQCNANHCDGNGACISNT